MIITINREFGSGGRKIGELLASQLGYEFYDKTLIEKIAQHSGFAPSYVEELEEFDSTPSFLYQIAVKGYISKGMFGENTLMHQQKTLGAQNKVVEEIAEKGNCVILGRAANYTLREKQDVVSVFVHAPLADRITRAVNEYDMEKETAKNKVKKIDRLRANFYKQYTGDEWTNCRNYHLCIDTSFTGLNHAREFILKAVNR